MKQVVYLFMIILCTISWYGCKEEEHLYYKDNQSYVPEQVRDLNVFSVPGGVNITYKVPKDKTLSYVKAVYEIQPGVFREAKSSFYNDTLKLVGFGDTLNYSVNIYSVGKNEKMSPPINLSVKPLLPPVKTVFETITLDATFGGLNITFDNESRADLAIFVLTDTIGDGQWESLSTYYTSAMNGKISVRGLKAKEGHFAIYLRDRWSNKSDTLMKTLTPLYEELIPHSYFKLVTGLPSDKNLGQGSYSVANLFNGSYGVREDWYKSQDDTYPQWFTMDMNKRIVFSRMKLYQAIQYPYVPDWVKEFEIWGTNNLTDNWGDWTMLGKFESIKPSGLPDPSYTAEDLEYEGRGEDYDFPEGLPAVRYLRFKVLINRGGGGKFYVLNELTFWGQIEE
jgi:hypothetical protein